MYLDTKTTFFFLFLTNWIMGLSLLVACGKRMRAGEAMWTSALFVQGLALFCMLARDSMPVTVSILLGNGLLSASFSLAYLSVCRIFARPPSLTIAVAPPLVLLLGVALSEVSQTRVLLLGAVCGIQELLILHTLTHPEVLAAGGRSLVLLIAGYVTGAVLFAIRAVVASSVPNYLAGQFPPNLVDTVTLALAFAGIIMTALGMLLIHRHFMERETQRLATLDSLTGIFNRRILTDLAARAVSLSRRKGRPMALLMLDLDEFKHINDSLGHRSGDEVLIHVVKCVQSMLRPQDVLGRYGGEEFCVVLAETNSAAATTVAERIRAEVAARPTAIAGTIVRVTLSIGVAVTDGEASIDDVLSLADQAMYEAKASGRNRVVLKHMPGKRRESSASGWIAAMPARAASEKIDLSS